MRTGILVLGDRHRVLLANQSATTLLGGHDLPGHSLAEYSPQLVSSLQQWQQNPALRPPSLQPAESGPTVQPSFIPLRRGNEQHILMFLEDISQIAQQAQQLKLAALGRLTPALPMRSATHWARSAMRRSCCWSPKSWTSPTDA